MKQPNITIGQDVIQLLAEIDDFQKRWRTAKGGAPDRLRQLRTTAFIESVGASCRIAGAALTNAQVEMLLSGEQLGEGRPDEQANDASATGQLSADEAQAVGYAEALERVLESPGNMELTIEQVRTLHRSLPGHARSSGEYGSERGEEEKRELQHLLRWTANATEQGSVHPILLTAIFKVGFLAIQPYRQGNGRLARLLARLLLLRAGYDYLRYTSLEAVIEKEADYYHKALQRTQATLSHDAPDWRPWFIFFLRYLQMQTAKLAPAVEQIEGVDSRELAPLSMDVLIQLSQHGELSLTQLTELTGAGYQDLEIRLRELVDASHIQDRGEGRYRLAH